jgi:hypothetical protein
MFVLEIIDGGPHPPAGGIVHLLHTSAASEFVVVALHGAPLWRGRRLSTQAAYAYGLQASQVVERQSLRRVGLEDGQGAALEPQLAQPYAVGPIRTEEGAEEDLGEVEVPVYYAQAAVLRQILGVD